MCSLQKMIVGDDVLVVAILHVEAAGNDPKLHKAEGLVEASGTGVAGHYRVELQDGEAMLFALKEAVRHQQAACAPAAAISVHGVTGVADVPAAAF